MERTWTPSFRHGFAQSTLEWSPEFQGLRLLAKEEHRTHATTSVWSGSGTLATKKIFLHFVFVFWDMISLYNSGWPRIHCVAQTGLSLSVILLSAEIIGMLHHTRLMITHLNLQKSVLFYRHNFTTSCEVWQKSKWLFLQLRDSIHNHICRYQYVSSVVCISHLDLSFVFWKNNSSRSQVLSL